MKKRTLTIENRKLDIFEDGNIFAHGFIDSGGQRRKRKSVSPTETGKNTRKNGGYFCIGLSTTTGVKYLSVARLVATAFIREPRDGEVIDHIDGNKHNNHHTNLRWVSHFENVSAFRTPNPKAASKYRGVVKGQGKKKPWSSTIKSHGKKHHLGHIREEVVGAIKYDRAAEKLGFQREALNKVHYPELALLSGATYD